MILTHEHLIVRAMVTQPPKSIKEVKTWVKDLVPKIKMRLMGEPLAFYCDKKGNKGATCVAVIETSHIALHVWDENNPSLIQLDVYSCSKLYENVVFEHLEQFKPEKIQYKLLDRNNSLITVPSVKEVGYSTSAALADLYGV